MTLTSRRRRPLNREIPYCRDTNLLVIATEGEFTEKQYFQIFQRKSSRVQVKILETKDSKSSPHHVLNRLKQYKKEFEFRKTDQFWLVIDKDRWPDKQLANVATDALKNSFNLAVSRPCFEVWLYLHRSDPPSGMAAMTGNQVKEELRSLLGSYNEKNLLTDDFEPYIKDAVDRARVLDVNPNERWPNKLGTRVYLVVIAIQDIMKIPTHKAVQTIRDGS